MGENRKNWKWLWIALLCTIIGLVLMSFESAAVIGLVIFICGPLISLYMKSRQDKEVKNTETTKWYKKNISPKILLACLLLFGGLICGIYFLIFFDASVLIPRQEIFGQEFGGQRVNNIGLMQDKQNGIYLGFGAAALGLLIIVLNKERKEENEQKLIEK